MALIALMTLGVAHTMVSGQMQTYDALHEARGMSLAEVMLEEILCCGYTDPDGVDGELSRAQFDDLDDYAGYAEALGAVGDKFGTAYPEAYGRFRREVSVSAMSQVINPEAPAAPGLLITVTVTDDAGRQWQLDRFVPQPAS